MQKLNIKNPKPRLLTIVTIICITSCQTTRTPGPGQLSHVIAAQNALIESVLIEREREGVKLGIKENATLQKAEGHLKATLRSIRKSNQMIRKVLKHETNSF